MSILNYIFKNKFITHLAGLVALNLNKIYKIKIIFILNLLNLYNLHLNSFNQSYNTFQDKLIHKND
jgi:hypothetical protein